MPQYSESAYHYRVISRAIKIIDEAKGQDLSLEELASCLSMSPAHFQRTFSRWAGVSPKRYQQYLTLGYARALVHNNISTMNTAMATELSGSGRLHDLFLRWEAMSPGEYARRGEGLDIHWGWFDSPFGDLLAMATKRGLCGLAFSAELGREATLNDMKLRWPKAKLHHDPNAADHWVQAALKHRGDVRLLLSGGPFQIKIWEALMTIPSGYVSTYSEIARTAGVPSAVRSHRNGHRAQSDQLADSLPSCTEKNRRAGRLSLGIANKAITSRVGKSARRDALSPDAIVVAAFKEE